MKEIRKDGRMRNQDKLLTVSIASYNVENYLAETLQSCVEIPENLLSRLEVIVVNDGSKDATLEIAKGYEKKYPQAICVVDKENGGYGSTINSALKLAKGKYFRYLDGDDWFDSKGLAQFLKVLNGLEVDAIVTPYTKVFESTNNEEFVDDLSDLPEGEYLVRDLPISHNIGAVSLTWKTQLLVNNGFQMSERCFYTDTEYAYIPFNWAASLYVKKIPLYRYRLGREGQSVSKEGVTRHYKDLIRVCSRLFFVLKTNWDEMSPYLRNCLIREMGSPFYFLTRIDPSDERKRDLQQFNSELKTCSDAHRALCKYSKTVKLLNYSGFSCYKLMCIINSGRK